MSILDVQRRLAELPPQPVRVRVTQAMWDTLRAQSRSVAPGVPLTGTLAGLPVVVDEDLPASPGWALDYPESPPRAPVA